MKAKIRKHILVVEDDDFLRKEICEGLHDRGMPYLEASNEKDAYAMLDQNAETILCALLDIRLHTSAQRRDEDSPRGRLSGLRIARHVRTQFPAIKVMGMSFFTEESVRDWFHEFAHGFLRKDWLALGQQGEFYQSILKTARRTVRQKKPQSFIVHGHDGKSVAALKKFITGHLRWPRPLVLREMASGGRTIIEKFEEAARAVRVVFVLLTPDDVGAPQRATDDLRRRARQNVIFEMGFFFAKLQRVGGRVLLLHKGAIELPSDIQGMIYIDISKGLQVAREEIETELQRL
jgi:CheY-like chemotaxis protein